MKARYIRFLFLTISLIGFILIYWLWPNNEKLPVLDKIDQIALEDVHRNSVYESGNSRVKLVAFFYTHCPDICPLTMVDFREIQEQLKNDGTFGKQVELVAISLDPEVDTPPVIQEYAHRFGADLDGWRWLRGTLAETDEVAVAFDMLYQKLEGDFFSHSTTMYLLDEKNQLRALYGMATSSNPVDKNKIIEDINYLVED